MTQVLFFISFLGTLAINAQKLSDTIFVFEFKTKAGTHILPIIYDTTLVFDKTSSDIGSLGNKALLPATTPTADLFPGSVFTNLTPVRKKFKVSDYPARVAVNIHSYQSGTVIVTCGGTIVDRKFVVTSAFCAANLGNSLMADSMVVFPAYDNGVPAPPMTGISVTKIYTCGKLFDNLIGNALLQLESDAGSFTGWVGIAYSEDNTFYNDKVLHKFSHPSGTNPFDSSEVFNGDTMYYNYGKVQGLQDWIIVPGGKPGIPGQGGSSLLYTNNNDYFVMGSLALSANSLHTKIDQETFYAFEHVFKSNTTGLQATQSAVSKFGPNPFSDKLRITLKGGRDADAVQVFLYGAFGKQLFPVYQVEGHEIVICRDGLMPGVYVLKISDGEYGSFLKVVVD